MAKHVSDGSSISNVAMSNKDGSKSDDDTRLVNLHTSLSPHTFYPTGAKVSEKLRRAKRANTNVQRHGRATALKSKST